MCRIEKKKIFEMHSADNAIPKLQRKSWKTCKAMLL